MTGSGRVYLYEQVEELEFSLQGIEKISQSFRDKIAPSESDRGHWSPGVGGSAQRRTEALRFEDHSVLEHGVWVSKARWGPSRRADGAGTSPESLGCNKPRKRYSKVDKQDEEERRMCMGFGIVGIRYGSCVTIPRNPHTGESKCPGRRKSGTKEADDLVSLNFHIKE